MAFAKLFETAEYGQIVVMLDTGDRGPELRFFCEPPGLGVCSLAMGFTDSDDGWDKAEDALQKCDEARSKAVVSVVFKDAASHAGAAA